MNPPLVSVIVPVFNCERYLEEALRSIQAQAYEPLEIIAVDDGSTDRSAGIAAAFPGVNLIRQANAGVAAARNTGLAAARGAVIAWLDADDFWLPGKLALETRRLADNPATQITLCHQRMFVTPGDPVPEWVKSPRTGKWLGHSLYASVMRREIFQAVGLFDPAMRTGEDLDWYMRAREAGFGWDTLDPVLVAHRVRRESLTGDNDRLKQDMIRVARMSLQRRRAATRD